MNIKYILLFFALATIFNCRAGGRLTKRKISVEQEQLLKQWSEAAKKGNMEVILKLLGKVDLFAQNRYSSSALLHASNNEDIIKLLLQNPGIFNAQDVETALIGAACCGHENIVKFLFKIPGINIDAQENACSHALFVAAFNGHENVIKLLLQAPGININAQDKNGFTALMHATQNSQENIVKILLQASNINIIAHDKNGLTAFMWAKEIKIPGCIELAAPDQRFIQGKITISKLIQDK